MKNNQAITKVTALVKALNAADSRAAELVAFLRSEYGIKDGSRIAAKNEKHVEEQVAHGVAAAFPGVTAVPYGKGYGFKHAKGAKATATARKMKERVLKAIYASNDSNDAKASNASSEVDLLTGLVAWEKQALKAKDAGKLSDSQSEKVRAKLDEIRKELV